MTGARDGDDGSGEGGGGSSFRSEWRNVKLIFDESSQSKLPRLQPM